ncbi:hypothetical protein GA0115245_108415 [Streptomyces sp. di188]|nr:hypothetical protein GA0115245_108415 [Streptomyces sp. di188]SCD54961.1 hypothetical protein GA0115238_114615 [Streptomyces sp. di50b]
MTVLEDRIEMAESGDELTLDMMFEWLEKMPVPEGYKAEIVGGARSSRRRSGTPTGTSSRTSTINCA